MTEDDRCRTAGGAVQNFGVPFTVPVRLAPSKRKHTNTRARGGYFVPLPSLPWPDGHLVPVYKNETPNKNTTRPTRTRTRTNTNPNGTEANAAGRSGNARALRKQNKCGMIQEGEGHWPNSSKNLQKARNLWVLRTLRRTIKRKAREQRSS